MRSQEVPHSTVLVETALQDVDETADAGMLSGHQLSLLARGDG